MKFLNQINNYFYLQILKDDTETDDYELEAPKFLADVFESVAGAIYLDSDCSLETVWRVYYKMLKPYLGISQNQIKNMIETLFTKFKLLKMRLREIFQYRQ